MLMSGFDGYRHGFVACVILAMTCAASSAGYDDNFNDNLVSDQWNLITDAPGQLDMVEANGRAEVAADGTNTLATDDALYLSNGTQGFRMSTASDFEIQIDYNYTNFAGTGTVALVFGVGVDPNGEDSAAIGFSRSSNIFLNRALGIAYRIGGPQTEVPLTLYLNNAADTGTFTVSYDVSSDTLTLGRIGDTGDVPGLVQGSWGNPDELWVSFGARGEGLTLNSGEAYFDNFEIISGTAVAIPEPGTMALLAALCAGCCRKRMRRNGYNTIH